MAFAVLILGSDWEHKSYSQILEAYPGNRVFQVAYVKQLPWVQDNNYIELEPAKEVERLTQLNQEHPIRAILNRVDSYIPLHGKLCDAFGVPGPSLAAVAACKDKAAFDTAMRAAGLSEFRPRTQIVHLSQLENNLERSSLPVIVKPYSGSKSRGVFKVTKLDVVGQIVSKLISHFSSAKMFRAGESAKVVLIEEFIGGQQGTSTGWVDSTGQYHHLGFSSVLTGTDLGLGHAQILFRTTPLSLPEDMRRRAVECLGKFVRAISLKSCCVFCDWKIDGKRIVLLEVNARNGGYRSEMYSLSQGFDLRQLAIDLALGEQVNTPDLSKKRVPVTAVEVWSQQSGKLQEVQLPEAEDIYYSKTLFSPGDAYQAPPWGDRPIGRFYVKGGDSLRKAQRYYQASVVRMG